MYHSIVKRNLRKVFQLLNDRQYDKIPEVFAQKAHHVFYGDHALSGSRIHPHSIRQWYERLPRALPDLHFEVKNIVVEGWPWHTKAVAEWRDFGTTCDGIPFQNQGTHFITLRWGKVTELRIYCDTAMLEKVLDRNAQCGIEQAKALPITDN
ncbi:nuclear transport factor 2 family protein [Ampullimonas aquatilis]|uniref:nuclear transport factor 2 family protein n=1 Tax=Ampullimonas aquatilis TaxID=1341549 RepID=UPI003C71BAC7